MYNEKIKRKGKNPIQVNLFDTHSEMVRYLNRPTRKGTPFDQVNLNDKGFRGRKFDSPKHVFDSCTDCWDYGLKVTDEMMQEISKLDLPVPKSVKRKPRFDEFDGDEIDLDRLRGGQPFWRTTNKRRVKAPPRVSIICNIAANCSTNHKSILWRGAAMLSLALRLEQAGYKTELWSCESGSQVWSEEEGNKQVDSFAAVRLKGFTDPIDQISVINAASGWYFRTLYFDMFYALENHHANCGLGRSVGMGDNIKYLSPREQHRVIIENVFSKDEAVKLIKSSVEAIDVNMD